jgi:hypothetical protein
MRSYIDLYFTPGPTPPLEISKRLSQMAGLSFIVGTHDLTFQWITEEEFYDRLSKVHAALEGTGVSYRVETILEGPESITPIPWSSLPPRRGPVGPAY